MHSLISGIYFLITVGFIVDLYKLILKFKFVNAIMEFEIYSVQQQHKASIKIKIYFNQVGYKSTYMNRHFTKNYLNYFYFYYKEES